MAQRQGRFLFQGLFSQLFTYKGTVDVASLADGAGASQTFTVTGVALGDLVIAQSIDVSTAGITLTGNVTAADTVTLRFQNESGGTLDLAAANVYILVGSPSNQFFIT
jgi:hypothetical protein